MTIFFPPLRLHRLADLLARRPELFRCVVFIVVVLVSWKLIRQSAYISEEARPFTFEGTPISQIKSVSPRNLKFFILAPPQVTSELVVENENNKNQTIDASIYYQNALNEESAEIWLHRGFDRMTLEEGRTLNPAEADIFLISGYLHLHSRLRGKNHSFVQMYKDMIVDRTKPHLMLIPSWNPGRSQEAGIKALAKALRDILDNKHLLWSVGFERNSMWQGIDVNRILPIPYVVRPSSELKARNKYPRTNNFVFYAGDYRRNAKAWGGCHRDTMILPFMKNKTNDDNMDIRLVGKKTRVNQTEYNKRMMTSEYCLIVCGDTPTSRSLTSAVVSGCIPIRVGSRLRGLCEPPCQAKWGWEVSGAENPHLPFADEIPWRDFPEVDEEEFTKSGRQVLQDLLTEFSEEKKGKLRSILHRVQIWWIYGWGDPVTSTDFGEAVPYVWNSFQKTLLRGQNQHK